MSRRASATTAAAAATASHRPPPGADAADAYLRPPRTLFLVREAGPAYEATPDGFATDGSSTGGTPTGRSATELDAIEELGDEIATLAAHIHAATHRLLVLIADFDRRRGWALDGHSSCAHWLAFRTGIDLGAAREKVRTARALVDLPATGASMARGELSFSQVRALTRIATSENEADLLELARGCTVAHLERMVRGWRGRTRKDEAARERANHEARTFSVFPDEDGMYVVRGRLEPEVAAVLMKAVEAASDALFREPRDDARAAGASGHDSEEAARRAAAQRRADAVGLLAERALAAGFGRSGGDEGGRDEGGRGGDEEGDDGGDAGGRDGHGAQPEAPISGSRAERFQVVLHADVAGLAATGLAADGDGGERQFEDGTRVSPAMQSSA